MRVVVWGLGIEMGWWDEGAGGGAGTGAGWTVACRVMRRVDLVVDEIVASLPAYLVNGRGRPVEDLHAGLRGLTELILRAVAEDRTLSRQEVAAVEEVGLRQAEDGVPVSVMVDSVRQAMRVLYKNVSSAAAEPPVPDDGVAILASLSLLLLDIRHQMTQAVTTPYGSLSPSNNSAQARAMFLHHLLDGQDNDEEELVRLADALGYYLGPPCGVLVLAPYASGDAERLAAGVDAFGRALPAAVFAASRAAPTLHVACVMPARTASSWAATISVAAELATANGLVVLASEPVTRLSAVSTSYRDARACLLTAREQSGGPRLVASRELDVARLLDAVPLETRMAFLRSTMGPLLALRPAQSQPLLDALDRCDGRMLEAAKRLGLHAKGLRYRLRKVDRLTGLSTDIPSERMRLDLALSLLRVAGTPPCGDPFWSSTGAAVPWDTKQPRTLVDGASTA